MNKSKLLGVLVASVGVVASFGSAFALYTKGVANIQLGIGAAQTYTGSGSVDYTINGKTNASVKPRVYADENDEYTGTVISETRKTIRYEFALGGKFADDVTEQEFLAGNLSVTFDSIHSSLLNHLKVGMYFDGYTAGTFGADTYGDNLWSGSNRLHDYTVTTSALTITSRDIVVRTNGTIKFCVWLGLNGVDFLAMNEASNLWNLSVSWTEASESFVNQSAYMVNNLTEFKRNDDFIMTPNIDRETAYGKQWTGRITGTDKLNQGKCLRPGQEGDIWEDRGTDSVTNDPINFQLENGTTYKVYILIPKKS